MTAAPEPVVETFLQRQLRKKAEREAAERPAATWATPTSSAPVEAGSRRAQAWAAKKLDNITADLAALPEGGRNHALNAAAYSLGRLVPTWLEQGEVQQRLYAAAQASGLEHAESIATITSGLRSGMDEPRDPPTGSDTEDSLAALMVGVPVVLPAKAQPQVQVEAEVRFDPATGEVLDPLPTEPAADAIERTTWWPKDIDKLVAGEREEEPPPAYLARDDGHRLFYAGKINGLIGESESGKTWVALLAVTQALATGENVLYLDFEDTAAAIVSRLQVMGATAAHLSRFSYISPDEQFGVMQHRDITEHVAATKPTLVILDGYNAAMTMLGLNLIDNNDIYRFALTLLRPLKKTGAAVVTIDHVTKSKEGRGAFAIGGQAKRSDVDGCALSVEVVQPFGKGMAGKLRLTVSKDRPGQVRAVSTGAKNAGMAHIDSTAGDSTRVWIEAPDTRPLEERGPFRPTGLMQKVSRHLERSGCEMSGKAVETEVGGKADFIRTALRLLVEEGYVSAQDGPRGATMHAFVKPYIEAKETTSSPRPDLVPTSSRDEVEDPHRPRPLVPPSMGDEGRGQGTGSETTSKTADLVPRDEVESEDWWKR